MPTLQSDIEYIRKKLESWHEQVGFPHPGVPTEMRVDLNSDEEWQSWRLIDSKYRLEDVKALEQRLPAPLPQFFQAFMLAYHTMSMDFGEYHLPESWCNRTLEQNFYMLLKPAFWNAGYMEIGGARGCGDPLLLDFRSSTVDGDYAVVLFNHDVVPRAIIQDREKLKPYESYLAPSFRRFFNLVLEHDDSIFPAPISLEEQRRDVAWNDVAELLNQKGLPKHHRPKEVSPSDPWAIAEFLRNKR